MTILYRSCFLLLAATLIPACGMNSTAQNGNAPSFSGLTSATPGSAAGEIVLTWSPALELNGGTLVYNIFMTNVASGAENLSSPDFQTLSSTGFTVPALQSTNHYWFIVQAQDSAGNVDGNTIEREAIAP